MKKFGTKELPESICTTDLEEAARIIQAIKDDPKRDFRVKTGMLDTMRDGKCFKELKMIILYWYVEQEEA